MYDILLTFVTSFAVTYFLIPPIIKVAQKKRLMVDPNERSSHIVRTPALGGIAIFAGMFFAIILWTPFKLFGNLQYILCALLCLFFIGARDDIIPIQASKKFLGELVAAFILVFASDVRIDSFYGLFGINELPYWFSIVISIFTFIALINAFNLIDGINGLAGTYGSLVGFFFGSWFFITDRIELSIIAFAMIGALVAFLYFNYSPAKIFMGDSGSLLLGMTCCFLAIEFIEWNEQLVISSRYRFDSTPIVAIGVLILPIFDTTRVFMIRLMQGNSPFDPDRNHLHHLALDAGLSHVQGTLLLNALAASIMVLMFFINGLNPFILLLIIIAIMLVFTGLLHYFKRQRLLKLAR